MFTGIVEEIGQIEKIQKSSHSSKLTVRASKIFDDVKMGDSIAVNGICLTVTDFNNTQFTVDVMNETWKRTTLSQLERGKFVNLERALAVNGRFGGHIVTGHIDGIGTIKAITKDSNAVWYRIETSKNLLSCIVEKGSIAIDGISLTIAKVSKNDFSVSVIPHTLDQTILKTKKIHDMVNLENDVIGKYIKKFLEPNTSTELSKEFLQRNGF